MPKHYPVVVFCLVDGRHQTGAAFLDNPHQLYHVLQDQIQIKAIEVQCAQPTEAELALYTYQTEEVPGQCCPAITRTACLLEDSQIPVSQVATSHTSL